MIQFSLCEVVTKDKLVHQGIYFSPKKKSRKAILWVHGLTGRFYGDIPLLNAFAEACEHEGYGFASSNNRGHDVIANVRKIDGRKRGGYKHTICGAGLERFEDCVLDIDAAIRFLTEHGFSEIILAGHSTGANKVCYYAGTRRDSRISAIVLAGPMSDRFSRNTDKTKYQTNFTLMSKRINQGRGDELVSSRHFFPMTPKRWISLLAPNTNEDVFNYGDKKNTLTVFAKIKKPLLVIFSELDETADRSIADIRKVFDQKQSSTQYQSVIVGGATHSYTGKEQEFVQTVMSWIKNIN